MVNLIILAVGFAALVYGANLLVDGAASLAKRFNIPNIVIGLTIVAFGTSAPELVVNVFASLKGESGITLGNVIGSNIFNVLFILGVTAIIRPLRVTSGTTWIEVPLALLAALAVLLLAFDNMGDKDAQTIISRNDGLVLLLFFTIFLVYNAMASKKGGIQEEVQVRQLSSLLITVFIVGGLVLLVAGGKAIVYSAVDIARMLGISERVIGLTIVSIGTSLPELATSVAAARKGNVDIAIGNVVGSNIFNIFFILGISATISSVPVSLLSLTDLWVNIGAGLLLFIFIFTGKGRQLDRWEGISFLVIYIAYITFLLF